MKYEEGDDNCDGEVVLVLGTSVMALLEAVVVVLEMAWFYYTVICNKNTNAYHMASLL